MCHTPYFNYRPQSKLHIILTTQVWSVEATGSKVHSTTCFEIQVPKVHYNVCVCMYMCMYVCACACVCVCVCVCEVVIHNLGLLATRQQATSSTKNVKIRFRKVKVSWVTKPCPQTMLPSMYCSHKGPQLAVHRETVFDSASVHTQILLFCALYLYG